MFRCEKITTQFQPTEEKRNLYDLINQANGGIIYVKFHPGSVNTYFITRVMNDKYSQAPSDNSIYHPKQAQLRLKQ